MQDEERFALIGGPYAPPAVHVGQLVECSLRGPVVVRGWSQGRITWPWYRVTMPALILCGDLERAVRVESAQAIIHWWGISSATVTAWRKFLHVRPTNPGGLRLMRAWVPETLTEEQRAIGRALAHQPAPMARMVATRRARGGGNRKPWTPEEDALLGTIPDPQAAKHLGRAKSQIGIRRRTLGIPAVDTRNKAFFEDNPGLVVVSPAKLVARRVALGLTQVEAAKRCDWHQVALSQIETGLRTRIRRESLERLAHGLECEPKYLLASACTEGNRLVTKTS